MANYFGSVPRRITKKTLDSEALVAMIDEVDKLPNEFLFQLLLTTNPHNHSRAQEYALRFIGQINWPNDFAYKINAEGG